MGLFSQIPRHIQKDVLKKLDFKDFARFKQCSRETVEITSNFNHRLLLNACQIYLFEEIIKVGTEVEFDGFHEEPICFETELLNVHSARPCGIPVEDFGRKYLKRATKIWFRVNEEQEQQSLHHILKISEATSLDISHFAHLSDLLQLPEIKQLKEFNLIGTKMEESYFLNLEMPIIHLGSGHWLTTSAINTFMKQWNEHKRIIEELSIFPIPREQHLEIFDGLEFSVEEIPANGTGRMEVVHMYSFTRDDGKKLFVSTDLFDNRARIAARESEDLLSFVHALYPQAVM